MTDEFTVTEEDVEFKISAYLFCRHLEQNGLYDYTYIKDAPTISDEECQYMHENEFKKYREQNKVLRRSGAYELLSIDLFDDIGFVEYLIDLDIIIRSANDIALKNSYWRDVLRNNFGDMQIFHEGYYSIDEKYWENK